MKRPLLIIALVTSVITLFASAAVAVGTLDTPSPGPSMMGAYGQGRMAGQTNGSMIGGLVWLPGDGVAVSAIPAARARTVSAGKAAGLHPGEVMQFSNGFYVAQGRRGQAGPDSYRG